MKPFTQRMMVALMVVWVAAVATAAESVSVLLQKGIFAEETEGNLEAAIQIYERIIAEAAANRTLIAQAHYRLGMCHLKKGKGVVDVAHRSQRWGGEFGLVVHQPEVGAGVQDVFHAVGTRARKELTLRLAVGETAPLLRRQRLDERGRVVCYSGSDQVRVPGEPGATGGKRHQFHRRAVWLAGDEDRDGGVAVVDVSCDLKDAVWA